MLFHCSCLREAAWQATGDQKVARRRSCERRETGMASKCNCLSRILDRWQSLSRSLRQASAAFAHSFFVYSLCRESSISQSLSSTVKRGFIFQWPEISFIFKPKIFLEQLKYILRSCQSYRRVEKKLFVLTFESTFELSLSSSEFLPSNRIIAPCQLKLPANYQVKYICLVISHINRQQLVQLTTFTTASFLADKASDPEHRDQVSITTTLSRYFKKKQKSIHLLKRSSSSVSAHQAGHHDDHQITARE